MLRFFHLLSEAGTKAPDWVRSEQQRERSTGSEAAVERFHPLLLPPNPSLSRIKSPLCAWLRAGCSKTSRDLEVVLLSAHHGQSVVHPYLERTGVTFCR